MSELEDLIREQADDMRHGHRLRRQGDPWMHSVISLDGQRGGATADSGPLSDLLDNQGRLGSQWSDSRHAMAWSCPEHGRRHSALDSMGRPQCAECHRNHMRAYAQSDKGKARHKRYAQRPEVRARRNERKRELRAARAAGIEPEPLPRGPRPRIPLGEV